jgi:hypothetical protein
MLFIIHNFSKPNMSRVLFVMKNLSAEANLGDCLINDILVDMLAPYGDLTILSDSSCNDFRVSTWTFHMRLLKSALLRSTVQTHAYLVLPPGQGLRKSWSTVPKMLVWYVYIGTSTWTYEGWQGQIYGNTMRRRCSRGNA